MPTDADALLAALDPLPYRERTRALAHTARRLHASDQFPALLADLAGRDGYTRSLALTLAIIGGDVPHVIRATRDPDPTLAGRAVSAARTLPIPDRVLADLLDDAPAVLRASIYRVLRTGRRTALADRLIGDVLALHGPVEAARVLSACGPTTALAYADLLGRAGAAVIRRHPEIGCADAERRLAALPASDRDAWWAGPGADLVAAGARFPLRVLDLIERHPPRGPLHWAFVTRIGWFVAADRPRVLRLLAASERRGPTVSRLSGCALRRLVGAGPDSPELIALGRTLRTDERALVRLLKAMAPAVRGEFLDAVHADRDRTRDVLPGDLLDLLPHDRRRAEARRMLALPAIAENESRRSALLAHLPFAEVESELVAATRRSDPSARAEGYRRLISCAARTRDPDTFGAVLRSLTRLRNEQDPVRRAALSALADVHPALFGPDAPDVLTTLTRDALDARDLSYPTRAALIDLAGRLLTHHVLGAAPESVDWALGVFEQVAGRSGTIPLTRLVEGLRRGRERGILAALLPGIRARVDRGDHRLLFALAYAFGRRAWDLEALQELLGRAARDPLPEVARAAIPPWLADPRQRTHRVAELVAWDPSTGTRSDVLSALVRHRTDLLDPYLAGRPPRGRFAPKDVRWVPDLSPDEVRRLLPRQRRAYAAGLVALADDAGQHVATRVRAIHRLARVPEFGRAALPKYLDAAEVPLVEAAMSGLTHTDDPGAALPTLLGRVGDDRARVAAYALSRAARYVPPSVLEPALCAVLFGPARVTARKEAARILSATGVPGAVDLLARAWSLPDQHRDVRLAILSRLADRPDHEAARAVLREAVEGPREAALMVLTTRPDSLPPGWRAHYAELITFACASPDPEVARAAYRTFPHWARHAPAGVAAIRDAVLDLSGHVGWREAADALHVLTVDGAAPGAYLAVIEALIALDRAPDVPNAEADRDRPARRRLEVLLGWARAWAEREPVHSEPVLRPVRVVLAAEPELRFAAARLTASGIPLTGDAVEADLSALVALCADRPLAALGAADVLRDRLTRAGAPIDSATLRPVARALAANPAPAAGLFGCTLVRTVGAAAGWPIAWRALLRVLRAHPDPDVRETALAVSTGRE
ncbi:hypothetical protein [Embleya sp. NPDC020630]|uniref:hypothetical protein n=1 Tax=Embleya sp. NPDC020630 TaxID=3363979 RepID=UPI0037B39B8D